MRKRCAPERRVERRLEISGLGAVRLGRGAQHQWNRRMAASIRSLASGQDTQEFFGAPLKQALANGQVTPDRLHDMVHRILRSMFANGLFDYPAVKRCLGR